MPGDETPTERGAGAGSRSAGAPATLPGLGVALPPRRALLALATLAAAICAAVVTQVFLAGLGLLVDPGYLAWHSAFVHVIEAAAIALIVLGVAARRGGALVALSAAPLLLILAQYALIHGSDGPVRALHAVNAFVLFAVSWVLAKRSSALLAVDEAASPAQASPTGPDARLGLAVAGLTAVFIGVASVMANQGTAGRAADTPPTVAGEAVAGDRSTGERDAADAALGARVFAENCAGCHGSRGEGRIGPRLAGNRALADRGFVLRRVSEGEGIMPAFRRSLSQEEIEAVVDHVRSSFGNGF
ncbi:MAG TPA: c-type cytochrome [Trueperaceae bacterium]